MPCGPSRLRELPLAPSLDNLDGKAYTKHPAFTTEGHSWRRAAFGERVLAMAKRRFGFLKVDWPLSQAREVVRLPEAAALVDRMKGLPIQYPVRGASRCTK